ncbi:hypothetical protein LEMLEM_LOCUS18299, partial [Lemmus lemmus]
DLSSTKKRIAAFQTAAASVKGAGRYSDPLDQAGYNDHILSLCTTAAMTAWSRLQEPGQQVQSYLKIKQGQREPFSDFVQRLTKAVQM